MKKIVLASNNSKKIKEIKDDGLPRKKEQPAAGCFEYKEE